MVGRGMLYAYINEREYLVDRSDRKRKGYELIHVWRRSHESVGKSEIVAGMTVPAGKLILVEYRRIKDFNRPKQFHGMFQD
jgi:hypothetical protein